MMWSGNSIKRIKKIQIKQLSEFIHFGCVLFFALIFAFFSANYLHGQISGENQNQDKSPVDKRINSAELRQLNLSLLTSMQRSNFGESQELCEYILQNISRSNDSITISDSYYLIGSYYAYIKNYTNAIKYLQICLVIRDKTQVYDDRYSKALYNLGVVYYGIGDYRMAESNTLKSIEAYKKIHGETNPELINLYSSLITDYIELQDYEQAVTISNIALAIANNSGSSVPKEVFFNLYYNLGVCYIRLFDFSKSKIYLDKTESVFNENNLKPDDNYINLMNSMAITCSALGFAKESEEYYERGIAQAISINSPLAYNTINSYAILLGNAHKQDKGEVFLKRALERAKARFGDQSHNYFEVLMNYANYIREYKIDNNKSIECFRKCLEYLSNNDKDILLTDPVYIGYSLSLCEAGEHLKALEIIQSLLYIDFGRNNCSLNYNNPGIENIIPDKKSLTVLKTKYKILWDIFNINHNTKTLEEASNTSELIVSLLEKVRINISEEDSRLLLGDKYRDFYLCTIRDFNILYKITSDYKFLEKAFEYSEKSKVAGLLTSSRELKAVQLHIPQNIADMEKQLEKDISLFNANISEESLKKISDSLKINTWKQNLLVTTRLRDSLIQFFETSYPGYFAFKYNTRVSSLKEIPEIVGRNGNYINYVLSDTILYIFVVNRRNQQLLSIPIDSAFYSNLNRFRNLLSKPSPSDDSRIAFEQFQSAGNKLYNTVFKQIKSYLISDKIFISPDNILSYLPFETIPTSFYDGDRISYKKLNFLMDDFDISYIYSATFMAETVNKDYSFTNKTIAFAPYYPNPINIQNVFMNRQAEEGVLYDLPYARQEAEYVTDITNGKLYENSEAKESVYKSEAGKYDIIHLAMHTLLNDKSPMRSTLIFSTDNDTIDDGYLKTFEVYGIPLKTKMVVLSSCNTGSGLMSSGEGILSLARGFIYSGSQSVVMSMWEIEDRSGTDIVKMFYSNLKKGFSKSASLKKARITYLENADQYRSHPYFWSALVVYGSNTPLYYSKYLFIAIGIIFITIIVAVIFYVRKRRYS